MYTHHVIDACAKRGIKNNAMAAAASVSSCSTCTRRRRACKRPDAPITPPCDAYVWDDGCRRDECCRVMQWGELVQAGRGGDRSTKFFFSRRRRRRRWWQRPFNFRRRRHFIFFFSVTHRTPRRLHTHRRLRAFFATRCTRAALPSPGAALPSPSTALTSSPPPSRTFWGGGDGVVGEREDANSPGILSTLAYAAAAAQYRHQTAAATADGTAAGVGGGGGGGGDGACAGPVQCETTKKSPAKFGNHAARNPLSYIYIYNMYAEPM